MTGYATPDLSAMYARLGPGICTYRADDGVNQLTLLREGREGRDGVPLQQLSLTQGEEHDGGVELVVAYSGDSRASMLKTLEALHLPKSWSKHYGQKPFHLLLGQLQLRGAYEGPLELQVTIVLGNERQLASLEQVLRRFHAEYSRN